MLALMLVLGATVAEAKVATKIVDYEHDGVTCEGYFAYGDDIDGPRPGILVVHQWMGQSEFEQEVCKRLAALGYAAFAADVYGKGVRPANREQAMEQATLYRSDRALMRARVAAALRTMKAQPQVDPEQTAAIGYCFGGGCALELARSGADITGVVSFHGNLDTPDPADAQNIRCSVLVMTGADDPSVPPAQVDAFENEMRAAGVDWQLTSYGNAVHAFTDYRLGSDNSAGAAYNEKAAHRSWQAMLDFFTEIFSE
jgi:dienelactone hydrolase